MQKNKPALKKKKNESVIIEVLIVVLYSLLNLRKNAPTQPFPEGEGHYLGFK